MKNKEEEDIKQITDLVKADSIAELYKPVIVQESDVIVDVRCKFCKLPDDLKEEAHNLFEQCKSFTRVMEFINSKGYDFNVPNVRSHIDGHYMATEHWIRTRAYVERLQSAMNVKMSRVKRLEMQLAILDSKFLKYASMELNSLTSQTKIDDLLLKFAREIQNVLSLLKQEEDGIDLVRGFVSKVRDTFAAKLNSNTDPNVKNILIGMVKEFELST